MPRIMTICPTTGQPAPTNLTMDASTFRIIRLEGQAFDCPFCKQRHVWQQHEAWVDGTTRPTLDQPQTS
jgi:hypothetical protein